MSTPGRFLERDHRKSFDLVDGATGSAMTSLLLLSFKHPPSHPPQHWLQRAASFGRWHSCTNRSATDPAAHRNVVLQPSLPCTPKILVIVLGSPRPLAARPASALSRPIRCRGSNEGGTASCMQWQQERRRKLGCQGPGWRRAKQRVQRTVLKLAGKYQGTNSRHRHRPAFGEYRILSW